MSEGSSGEGTGVRRLWCLWGALLAAVPCTIRSSVISLFEVPALVASLRFQVEPLALALVALVLLRCLSEDAFFGRSARVLRVGGPMVACVGVPAFLLSEAGWLPMRLGDLSLLDAQPTFELVGCVALAASLTCWALYGASLASGAGGWDVPMRRTFMWPLLRGSVWAPLLLSAVSLLLPAWGGFALCAASGVVAWRALRRVCDAGLAAPDFLGCALVLVGGLFISSAFGQALGEVMLFHPMNFPDASLVGSVAIGVVGLALVALVLGLACRSVRWGGERASDPAAAPSEHDLLDLLPGSEDLSERQRDVLLLRLEGTKGSEVASALGVSPGTVSTYQKRALDTLGFERLDDLLAALERLRAEELARRSARAQAEARSQARRGAVALLVALSLPLVALTPPPYQESALLVTGGLLGLYALARMAREGAGLSGCDLAGVEKGERVLTCASALSLGLSMSAGVYFFSGVVRLELLTCLTATRLRWNRCGAKGEGEMSTTRVLGIGVQSAAIMLPVLFLLVGLGATLQRVTMYSPIYFGISRAADEYIYLFRFALEFCCMGASVISLVYRRSYVAPDCGGTEDGWERTVLRERGLNETEAQIMALVAAGLTRGQIAAKLHVAVGTVNGAKATAYRKLSIHSADELRELLRKAAG